MRPKGTICNAQVTISQALQGNPTLIPRRVISTRICTLINIIAQENQKLDPIARYFRCDGGQIEDLLDHSIVPTGYTIDADAEADSIVDLSRD